MLAFTSMRSITLIFLGLASTCWTAPAVDISQSVISNAGGGVPDPPDPKNISQNAISGFTIANFIENVEASFFAQAMANMTSNSDYMNAKVNGVSLSDVVTKVAAQEAVHVATIETLLTANGAKTVPPCKYLFSVSNMDDFLVQANVITSASIGAVNALSALIAQTDPDLVTSTTTIITVEARHDAFFRVAASEVPNPTPFDTPLSPTYAFNLILSFVQPDSCPQLPDLPVLPQLTVASQSPPTTLGAPAMAPTSVTFAFDSKLEVDAAKLFVGWLNQANEPVYSKLTLTSAGQGTTSVPKGLNGVAFAAVTNQSSETTVDGLTAATVAGPVAIVIT
jgi:Ferritin-like domain